MKNGIYLDVCDDENVKSVLHAEKENDFFSPFQNCVLHRLLRKRCEDGPIAGASKNVVRFVENI